MCICSSLLATADVVVAGSTVLERPNGLVREVREHKKDPRGAAQAARARGER